MLPDLTRKLQNEHRELSANEVRAALAALMSAAVADEEKAAFLEWYDIRIRSSHARLGI